MAYKTEENLQDAFAGESTANRRYTYFAMKAEDDGYPQIARLFRAIAEAESVHALNHLKAMDAIGSTRDNVTAGSIGEHQEFTRIYPAFIEKAVEERNERARLTFSWANAVEKIHHGYFEEALKAVTDGTQLEEMTYCVCQTCGNTIIGEAPEKCPICGAVREMFKKID